MYLSVSNVGKSAKVKMFNADATCAGSTKSSILVPNYQVPFSLLRFSTAVGCSQGAHTSTTRNLPSFPSHLIPAESNLQISV